MKTFLQYITEKLDLTNFNLNKGKKKVNIFIGRFQPLHSMHVKRIIDGKITEVFIVKPKELNEKSPFPFEIQQEMIKDIFGSKVNVHSVNDAFIGNITNILREENKEPIKLFCGTDREKTYKELIKRYTTDLNLNIEVEVFDRISANSEISGTNVRKSLKDDDFESFKKYMTKEIATKDWFSKLKKYIKD